jgi:hypothetical protein
MGRKRAAVINHRAFGAVPESHQGLGPLPALASFSMLPRELPPTHSLSLASEQSRLCVQGWHGSLRPRRANTRPGTARSQSLASSSSGGGPYSLVPVDQDLNRDSNLGEHTLPEARAQKAGNEIFPAQGPWLLMGPEKSCGHGKVSLLPWPSCWGQGREFWALRTHSPN